jgi:O-antigen/teichoic acid export membrane protein
MNFMMLRTVLGDGRKLEKLLASFGPSARNATGGFGLRIVNLALSFLTSILLVRLMGAAEYGTYVYLFTWLYLLSVVAVFGLDKLLIRDVATYLAQASWSLLKGIIKWSDWFVALLSVLIGLVMAIVMWQFTKNIGSITVYALIIAMLLLPLLTLTTIKQATTQGLSFIIQGQLPELLVRPLLFIAFIFLGFFYFNNMTAGTALGLHALAALITLIVATWLLKKIVPNETKLAKSCYKVKIWVATALPILLSQVVIVANSRADVLLLGLLEGSSAVSIYHVTKRLADLVVLPIMAVNVSIGPKIATFHAEGNQVGLQQLMTKSSRAALAGSLLIVVSLFLFGRWTLLLWGEEFTEGYITLLIMIMAQMVDAVMGPAALLLTMAKYERDVFWGVGAALIVNILFNLWLTPIWGIVGTAVANLISLVILNTTLVVLALYRLNIDSTALGKFSRYRTSP